MTRLLHRVIGKELPVAISGSGIELIDESGKRYIDGSSGAVVSNLGHNNPDVLKALGEQLTKLPYVHGSFFTTEAAEELADRLSNAAPPGLDYVYLVSGGSEGVEASIKLARQYFLEKNQPQRTNVIGRRQSYHGNTLGALAVGGNAHRRRQFLPLLFDTHHVAPCFEYRHRKEWESHGEYAERAASDLEAKIQELGPETVIAFVAETVVGATTGAVPPVADYFKRVKEICKKYGILLILDEVMCGMGRTGTLFAFEQENIVPDIVVVAKGLGGGYQPLGAVLLSKEIYDALSNGSKVFEHAHTYASHPMAAAAGAAVLRVLTETPILDNVKKQGSYLGSRLRERFGQHENVGDIRGRGLLWGIELVKNRESKEPFDPSLKLHSAIKREAMSNGLMVYAMGGTIDGVQGDHILVAPPFIVTTQEIDEIVTRLETALRRALAVTQQ